MVMRSDVLAAAVDHALEQRPEAPVLAMTPRGRPLTQRRVRELASGPGLTIICGRFEGIDERLFEARPIEPISIGDYILSGGETAARSEEHTSELQSLMRISYAVFCLKKKNDPILHYQNTAEANE